MQEGDYVEGAVSLWVGVSPSREALEKYTEIDYSTNDMSRVSPFADDFDVGFYDEDISEANMSDRPTRSLAELLRGCSYGSTIIPRFVKLCGDALPEAANAFVLLYDFQHRGEPGTVSGAAGQVKLRYMGSITVDAPWPD